MINDFNFDLRLPIFPKHLEKKLTFFIRAETTLLNDLEGWSGEITNDDMVSAMRVLLEGMYDMVDDMELKNKIINAELQLYKGEL